MTSVQSFFCITLLSLFTTQASASLMVFDDHSAFQTAVSGGTGVTLDFEPGIDPFDYFTLEYEDDYGSSSGAIDSGFDTTSGSNYLGVDIGFGFLSGGDFTLSFNQTWQAIGMYLIASDELFDDDVTLTAGAGSISNVATTTSTLNDGGKTTFVGIVDTDGFTTAQLFTYLDSVNGQGAFEFNIDDIQLVNFAQASVFEPSMLSLYALLGLLTLRLGRNKTSRPEQ
ncbi:MAG: hypothetical protein ACI9O6_000147 [Glaciecola sp.]|jgi:hypothetical protein